MIELTVRRKSREQHLRIREVQTPGVAGVRLDDFGAIFGRNPAWHCRHG
jgi:hypothetical protein